MRRITNEDGSIIMTATPTTEAELAEAYDHLAAAAAIYQRHEAFVAAHQQTVADAFNAQKELIAAKADTVRLLEQRDAEHKRKLRQCQDQLHDYAGQITGAKAALEDLQGAIAKGQAQLDHVKKAVAAVRTRHDMIEAKKQEHLAWLKTA
jgi:chromosome segregation ATPase